MDMTVKYKRGVTFGTFDLFHYGHLSLLLNAKAKCEYLIVGLSSSDYVRKHKNKLPFIPLYQRMAIVYNIKGVDEVVIQSLGLGKKTLIEMYKPDVLFVGDDWTPATYSGEGLGVPVIYLPHTPHISSTNIRQRLSGKNSS